MTSLFSILTLSAGGIGAVVGCSVFYGIMIIFSESKLKKAQRKSEDIIEEANQESELKIKTAQLDAKEEWFKIKKEVEGEIDKMRSELHLEQQTFGNKEKDLNRRISYLDQREKEVSEKSDQIKVQEQTWNGKVSEVQQILSQQNEKLLSITNLSEERAKEMLLENLKERVKRNAQKELKRIKTEAKEKADMEAKRIIITSMQRYAAEHTVETTVSSFTLQDELKGKIIGREGRNIRTFEEATGVDVIVDDTPNTIILSSFDPIRREVARLSMEKLIADGRIHPTRIEEIVEKTKSELGKKIIEMGEQAVFDLNIVGIHEKLIYYLGRLNYRTSFGQNVLKHSKEVARLCEYMAFELNVDAKTAKRAALLHDIGKAIDREMEGGHAVLGGNLCKRFMENEVIVNAVSGHHEDVEPISIYPILVQVADAISATRPGARMETMTSYVNRVGQLEELAGSFRGVTKVFALQAGREVRVMVEPEELDDAQAEELTQQISGKIEEELNYPGMIKVTIIREKRIVGFAK